MNDLISRSALLEAITFDRKAAKVHPQEICERFERFCDYAEEVVKDAPAVDAEVVRHEGNTTFVTTDNLDVYADRIIVRKGNWCKVYYSDSDDAEVEG